MAQTEHQVTISGFAADFLTEAAIANGHDVATFVANFVARAISANRPMATPYEDVVASTFGL